MGDRVVVEEADRAVAVPQAQGDGFVGALLVEELEFEGGRGAVGPADDGQDQRGDAVHRGAVRSELPALQEVLDQGRQ